VILVESDKAELLDGFLSGFDKSVGQLVTGETSVTRPVDIDGTTDRLLNGFKSKFFPCGNKAILQRVYCNIERPLFLHICGVAMNLKKKAALQPACSDVIIAPARAQCTWKLDLKYLM